MVYGSSLSPEPADESRLRLLHVLQVVDRYMGDRGTSPSHNDMLRRGVAEVVRMELGKPVRDMQAYNFVVMHPLA